MRMDPETMWMRPTDAARAYPPLQYHEIYTAARDGKIKAEQRGSAWYVWRPDVELMALKAAALRDGVATPELLASLARVTEQMAPAVRRIHLLGVQREVELRALEADAIEAETNGNPTAADTIRQTVGALRPASYTWNGSSWDVKVPGLGTISSQPTAPAKAGA